MSVLSWKRLIGFVLCLGLLYLPPIAPSLEARRTAAVADLGSAGELKHFRFESERLNDRMDLRVNVVTGNLILHAKDLKLSGTGLDLSVERFYNSLSSSSSQLGPGWVLGTGKDVRLEAQSNGDVVYFGPSGFRVTFAKTPAGSFTSPNGVDASLEKKSDGTYELTFSKSKEKFRFNSAGRFTEQVDKNDNKNVFAYNSDGTLASITDSRKRKTTFTYSGGLLRTIKDPAARTHAFGYDSAGRLASYVDPAKGTTKYAYDSGGLLTLVTDPRGNQTRVQYDAERRAISVTRVTDLRTGTGPTTRFSYVSSDKRSVVTDANGHDTTYKYDDDKRVTKVTDAKGKSRDVEYNAKSNVTTFLDAGQSTPLKFDYDPTGEDVTSITLPTSGTANFKYEDEENPHFPTSVFDFSNDSETEPTYSYEYDSKGNLTSATDKLGNKHTYAYNSNGTLKTVTDARNNVTSYSYDASGHQIKITPPAPLKPIAFTFDSVSRMTSMTDGNAKKTSFTYDALDRVTKITYADGSSVTYGYDANGNLTSRQDSGSGKVLFEYDALNRVVRETPPSLGGLLRYTYDAVGNLTSVEDDGGKAVYGYDSVNMVTSVTDPKGQRTTFGYDEDQNNLRTETLYPNGVKIGIRYDDSSRITEVETTKTSNGEILNRFSYGYQSSTGLDTNLRQHVTDKDGNKTTYSYDGVNRLTAANTANGAGAQTDTREYTYDPNSNLTSKKDNGATRSFAYNAANQLCWSFGGSSSAACTAPPAGATTFSYDGAGNLTGTSAGLSLLYNAKNQTTSMTPPGGTAERMTYQGPDQTRRISKGSTRFGYNVLGLSAQAPQGSGVANTTYFTRDNKGTLVSQRAPSGTHYYLFDGLGSVVGLTDASGNQVASYSYEPWGGQTSAEPSVANPWRFASGYKDAATGFVKFGTRYYDPTVARWTQQDPERGDVKQPLTLNLYLYAADNPLNVTDPTGRSFLEDLTDEFTGCDAIMAGLGIAIAIGTFFAPTGIGLAIDLTAVVAGVVVQETICD
ncbi:MAG: RHS repeat-associated core domain-containing protein [Actinomycetota bacterium]